MNETPQLGFIEAVKKVVVENYCNFNGRARRSEYWWFYLANTLLSIAIAVPMYATMIGAAVATKGDSETVGILGNAFSILGNLVSLALLLPTAGVLVRRLHDIGKSGWSSLICLIPCVGTILLIVWCCQDSDRGINEYGDSPKYPAGDALNSGMVYNQQ